MVKRARGGAYGGSKLEETNGKQEPGKFRKMNPESKVMEVGSKTTNGGFASGGATARKEGGKVDGDEPMRNLAKRARGGGVFSDAGRTKDRDARSESGHEGE